MQQDPLADFAARATRAYDRISAAFVRDLERMRPELEAAAEVEAGELEGCSHG